MFEPTILVGYCRKSGNALAAEVRTTSAFRNVDIVPGGYRNDKSRASLRNEMVPSVRLRSKSCVRIDEGEIPLNWRLAKLKLCAAAERKVRDGTHVRSRTLDVGVALTNKAECLE